MPDGGTITINLDQLYGGDQPFPEALVEAAARQALKHWTAPGPDGEQSEVPTALGRRIEETIAETIRAEAQAAAPKVAETILAEGVQQTSTYGSPVGERKPVRDIVAEKVVEQLTRREGHSGMREATVIEQMIGREVEKQVRAELQDALDEAKKAIADTVGAEATKALTDALRKALPGVKV